MNDLELQANLTTNVQFLTELRRLHQTLHLSGKELIRDPRWQKLNEQYRYDLERLRKLYGYHDVLFIDTDGNILSTLTNEAERGENIFTGTLADTLFAKACKRTLTTGRTFFPTCSLTPRPAMSWTAFSSGPSGTAPGKPLA